MDAQELAHELHHPTSQELLRSGSLARLAYNGQDGFPRVIPIGFYWNGERIVVCTAPTSPKVRALASRPQVALTIDTGDTPATAKALLVRGHVTMDTVDGIPDEYIAASKKTMEGSQRAAFEREVRSVYKQMVRISIEPQWARLYDFGAGRLPAFLARLVSDGESDSVTNTAR
jgi:Pyridoxamine 5'-phosphate oxidase